MRRFSLLLAFLTACVPMPAETPREAPSPRSSLPPFPDAHFGLYLEPEALRRALPTLPLPVEERVRRNLPSFPLLLAFWGTALGEGYGVRIGRVVREAKALRVEVVAQGPPAPPKEVRYTYPFDLRPVRDLPSYPFEVVFQTPEGQLLHRERVRPRVNLLGRPEAVGDPYGVVGQWQETYRDGRHPRRNLVRLHEDTLEVFYTPEKEGSRFYLDFPYWLQGATCALTDLPPEVLAKIRASSLLSTELTLRGVHAPLSQRHNLAASPLPPDGVPEQAYVACAYQALEAPGGLEAMVLDLYPARLLRRAPRSVEVLRAEAGPSEILLQVRLHPLPLEDVPLDLYTLNPPQLPNGERVAVFPYYGFDRDPTQPRYALSLHNGLEGFYLWILHPEVHTFTLYARLASCREAEGPEISALNPPPGASCPSHPLVEAFYTHRRVLGPGEALSLSLQFRSPRGWRSEPFTLIVP
ncbi:hypothetical protein [Thermus sp. LT1-2-5]|uniref:hypothetical protein n=1 Tax=Thermus sp. LT1-2-5 TaxID=3026935 RepID=UPI003365741B